MGNPHVKTVTGHSLAGSIALEMQKRCPHLTQTRTYGAPVWDAIGKESNNVDRYRNWLDPVSMLDRSAVKSVKWNPFELSSFTNDYSNLAKDFTSSEQVPVATENPDGSTSRIGEKEIYTIVYTICSTKRVIRNTFW